MPIDFLWAPEPAVVAEDFYASAAMLEDLEVPLTASLPAVIGGIQQIFDAEGPGWAPWAESYAPVASRENTAILNKTGALRGSTSDEGNYAVITDTLSWVGGGAPAYWGFHMEGTSRMPARPFIGLTPESEMAVLAIFAEWLESVISMSTTGAGQIVFRTPGGQFAAPI